MAAKSRELHLLKCWLGRDSSLWNDNVWPAEVNPPAFVCSGNLASNQERIRLAFLGDRGNWAMTRNNDRLVGQGKHGIMQGLHDFLRRAAGQVGTADGSGKQGVTRNQFLFRWKIKADAALGVSGRVEYVGCMRTGTDGLSRRDAVVNFNFARRGHSDPRSLHVEHLQQNVIVLVKKDRSSSSGTQLHGPADVIDVGVGDDNLFDLQIMLANDGEQVFDVIARVNHHRFPRVFIANH